MKKIIFFDADGTLWYPKATKRKIRPWLIYQEHKNNIKEIRKRLTLVPGVHKTLAKLKGQGIKLVVLSTRTAKNKYTVSEFRSGLEDKLMHFKIHDFFDEFHATGRHYESKGKYMLKIIKKYKVQKKDALMVGDMYLFDFSSAKKVGIPAVLFTHNYDRNRYYKQVRNKISHFSDVLKIE